MIQQAIEVQSPKILAVDCSFIPKSGKQTYGLDYFYNGSAAKAEKGLEISAMAVVDVSKNISYTLSVQQTPARQEAPKTAKSEKSSQTETTRVNHYLEQLAATRPYSRGHIS